MFNEAECPFRGIGQNIKSSIFDENETRKNQTYEDVDSEGDYEPNIIQNGTQFHIINRAHRYGNLFSKQIKNVKSQIEKE